VIGQLVLVALLFIVALGTRLGPARPIPVERQRSIREYLEAFGALTRRAKVERELVAEQRKRLRRLMHEREGVSIELPDEEAARELAQKMDLDPEQVVSLLARLERPAGESLRPREYLELSREVARLEAKLSGR
jgi:hypothetical protein